MYCLFWYHDHMITTSLSRDHSVYKLTHHKYCMHKFNTLRPRQNGRHFTDIFKCIFLNENVWIPIKNSLKFVPKGSINNIPTLVQIKAWRRPGDKPLSEPMMVNLPTHICVTLPQWVNRMYNIPDFKIYMHDVYVIQAVEYMIRDVSI